MGDGLTLQAALEAVLDVQDESFGGGSTVRTPSAVPPMTFGAKREFDAVHRAELEAIETKKVKVSPPRPFLQPQPQLPDPAWVTTACS